MTQLTVSPETLKVVAASHALTQATIEAVCKQFRGRDLDRETKLDIALPGVLLQFAETVAGLTLVDDYLDMKAVDVGADGWRKRLAEANLERLELYCLDRIIDRYHALLLSEDGVDGMLPSETVVRRGFWRLAGTASQVARMLAAEQDPFWLADAMPNEPHYAPPSVRPRTDA